MTPRSYQPDKSLPPQVIEIKKVQPIKDDLKPWEDGKLLHDLGEASAILTEKLGKGYSPSEMRRLIKNDLEKSYHWFERGRLKKFNIWRMIEWQATKD